MFALVAFHTQLAGCQTGRRTGPGGVQKAKSAKNYRNHRALPPLVMGRAPCIVRHIPYKDQIDRATKILRYVFQ